MQYNKMKLAVGIFVLTFFISASSFLYFLLDEKGTFDKRYNYKFRAYSAESFTIGMPVKFSGFNIGVVDKIELQNDGSVILTFSVNEDNRKWVAKGSVLNVKKPLIGSAYIIIYSALGNDVLADGSTLQVHISDDINDMVAKLEPVVDKLINIISSVDKITSYMARDDSEISKTLINIEKFSSNLAKNDALLTTVTGDKEATQSLVSSLKSTSNIMKEVYKMSKDIQNITSGLDSKIVDPTSSTIKELEAIMLDIKQKLNALDSTVNTVGSFDKDLVDLKEQISVGINKSNQIMDKVDTLMQNEENQELTLP